MGTQIDTATLEILASKICHDLISPIGAINNGLEILEETGPAAGKEVIDLIAHSAAQASAKLKVCRLAYGAGGADANIRPEDVYNAVDALVRADGKILQDWDPRAPFGLVSSTRGFCKILACALLLGMECLPRGGHLTVKGSEDGKHVVVGATGKGVVLREGVSEVLETGDAGTGAQPRLVHALLSALLSKSYGFALSISETRENAVSFRLELL